MTEISGRHAVVGAVALFVLVPLALQPFRPVIVQAAPLPKPTLWQSVTLFIGQFVIFGLAVWVWNLKRQVATLEAALEREPSRAQSGVEQ
jgi:hypothetical protein